MKTAGRGQKRRKQFLIQPDYKERDALEHGDMPICLSAFSSSRSTLRKSIVADSRRAMIFMSTAGSVCLLCLNISLTNRLTLLRVTAQPIFLLTVTPSRGRISSLGRHTRRKPLTAYVFAAVESPTNSARFRSRADLGNDARSSEQGLLGCNADGKIFAALGPSALDNEAAVLGCHPHQKTMGPLPGNVAGLKCSFHIDTSVKIFQELSL